MEERQRKILKVMVLGDSGVGKTSILNQYVSKAFTNSYKVTLGSDFQIMDLDAVGQKVRLQLWDTAGQEKYRSLSISYYRGSDACVFVFDLTDKLSFQNLDGWVKAFLDQIDESKQKGFPVILLGNKADAGNNAVASDTVRQWCAQNNDMSYFEVSAKTRAGIDAAFSHVAVLAARRAIESEYYLYS